MSDRTRLDLFLDLAWQRLSRGVADRRAAARHPAFATVAPDGRPEVRTVVLRAADRNAGTVEVHTDPHTAKVRALRHAPFAELHVWDPKPKLQIRLTCTVEILTGAAVADRWARVPDPSQPAYGTAPPPGTPIESAFAYEKPGVIDGFAVLVCRIDRIDLVDLETPHRRAAFSRDDGWRGQWCAP